MTPAMLPAWARGLALALLCAVGGVLTRLLLEPILQGQLPFIMVFPAVAIAAWRGGYRPALVTVALAYLGVNYFLIEPRGVISITSMADAVGLVGYLISCLIIVLLGESMRAANSRALHSAHHAAQRARTDAQFRSVVDTVIDGIISVNEHGIVQTFNPAAEKLFGYAAAEVIGVNVRLLMPEPYHSEHDGYIANYLRTGVAKVIGIGREVTGRRKDGSVFPMELAISEFAGGDGRCFTGIVRDISERKRSENALAQRNERLRLLWEAATVLLSTDNPDHMLRTLFAKISPHLGLDAYFNYVVDDSGDGLRLGSCAGIPDDAMAGINRLEFGQAICGTVALHRQAMVARHIQSSDDPKLQLVKGLGLRAYACNPLLVENQLIGTLSFGSRSRDEFDADELNFLETLTQYVAIAYERLGLVQQLRDTDRHKDEFLATLAHELRNPLAPVRYALELLQHAEGDGPTVDEAIGVMQRQVSQMVRLVDDLLDVARVTRGKLDLRIDRIELATVVNSAIETSRPLIEQMGHELTVALPSQPISLDADPVRVTQIFLNLLNNAAKYSEPKGHIWLTAERQGSDVVVTVKDAGIGIPADKLPHIFDMFTQVEDSLQRSQGGLGLGLTLVKRLTEMHGGAVEVRSDGTGRGSEFIVRLPIALTSGIEAPLPSVIPIAIPSRRILVVDDNRDGADSLAMMLRMLDNRVQTAYDGIAAVQRAEAFRPDIVLLDIGLPKLNGYEVAKRIRQEPWGERIIVIAVTGWGQEDDKRRSQEAGFNFHMVKPVNPADLEKLLAGLLPQPS